MTHHNTRQTTRTFTATFRRFQQHTASTTKAFVFGHVVLVFLFQHFSHRFGIASRASGFPRRIIPRWILVVSEHQNKKNKNKTKKYNTVSHRTFFFLFCVVQHNTALLPFATIVVCHPCRARPTTWKCQKDGDHLYWLLFVEFQQWILLTEGGREGSIVSVVGNENTNEKKKKSKEKKTHSLTCNPFNRGCIFDRQAMTLATKASFVDQDLTRHKRMQTQNTKNTTRPRQYFRTHVGPLPYNSPPTFTYP